MTGPAPVGEGGVGGGRVPAALGRGDVTGAGGGWGGRLDLAHADVEEAEAAVHAPRQNLRQTSPPARPSMLHLQLVPTYLYIYSFNPAHPNTRD